MKPLHQISVRVPASTSNLGPAFDCLGLALGLYNNLTLELHEGSGDPVFEIQGEGEATLPRNSDNLIARAASAVLAGRAQGRLVFKCVNRIPLARGLGSSAAAAVAGTFAANRLLGKPLLTDEQLLEYATVLEGHPDNVAPAVLGGLVVSARRQKKTLVYPLKAHGGLRAIVCIPDFELMTSRSRAALPETYLREDAVHNASRALLLASALERGLWDRLAVAMEDRIHQPYRAALVKGFDAVLKAAQDAGVCGAALSGAGPTMLALGGPDADAEKIGLAMRRAFASCGVESRALELPIDRQGVQVLK